MDTETEKKIDELDFQKGGGLIPIIVEDYNTKEVLTLAYMNKESLKETIDTGFATYYSRTRKKLWLKGETSGNFQEVKNISYDCDKDTLLMAVIPKGPACHTGKYSCFYEKLYERD